MKNSVKEYLDQFTFDYTQLCQRANGTVYGIASGKQCRQGKPISFNPNDLKLGAKPGLKQIRVKNKDKVKNIVAKAKAIGLNNKEIRQIKEEVKQELSAKRVRGKEALKLFAKKANKLAKEKKANTTKSKPKPKPDTTKPVKPNTPKPKPDTTKSIKPDTPKSEPDTTKPLKEEKVNSRSEALEKTPKYDKTPGSNKPLKDETVETLRDIGKDIAAKHPDLLQHPQQFSFQIFVAGKSNYVPAQVIYQAQGFNAKPELVKGIDDLRNRRDILTREDGSNLILYRGSSANRTNQLLGIGDSGDIHGAGKGIYGHGTYASAPNKTKNGSEEEARRVAESYVRKGNSVSDSVVTFGIRSDAKVLDFNSYSDYENWKGKVIKEAYKKTGLLFSDAGHAAAALGIHAYKIPNSGDNDQDDVDFWVILNRGAMVMVTDTYTPLN